MRSTCRFAAALAALALGGAAIAAPADPVEDAYWTIAATRGEAGPFETYLGRFPDGPHAAEARERLAALSPKPPQSGAIVVGAADVNGITGATPFETATLAAALPGFELAEETTGEARVIVVRANGGEVMRIEPLEGHVGHIVATGAGIADANGLALGAAAFAALPDPTGLTCFPRSGEGGMRIACTADLSAVTYVFAPARAVTATAEGTVDPAAIPPDAPLAALEWYPME